MSNANGYNVNYTVTDISDMSLNMYKNTSRKPKCNSQWDSKS